jgi:hypothetical protein
MNKRERQELRHTFNALQSIGFTFDECEKLRRISMTLRRWHELECGNGNDYASWAIERDEETEIPYMVIHHYNQTKPSRHRVADRKTGAKKRLAKILESKPEISSYIQGDPRGAALYILRPGDIPEGKDPCAYYSRGICVY